MSWLWLVTAVVLAAGLGLLEYRRARAAHRLSRILAVVGSVMALAVLWRAPGEEPAVTLLTPGAPLTAHSREALPLDQVASPGVAFRSRGGLRLIGWGLLPCEWPREASSGTIRFEPAPLPHEIVELDAPDEVGLGQLYQVVGRVALAPGDSLHVVLEDPAGSRDSAWVSAERPRFSLSDRPRAVGPAAYRIRLSGPGRPGTTDTLGLSVRELQPLGILILDASPSFETAFLKRWLGERGARVTVRTMISRDRFRNERLNGSPGVARLSPAALAAFDAVLLDGGSLGALSSSERRALRQAVEAGLGMLVTADVGRTVAEERANPDAAFAAFRALAERPDPARESPLVRPEWADAPRRNRVAIEAEALALTGGEILARDQADRPLAVRQRIGSGWVGLTLLRAPSRWLLEGDADLYASYWSTLLVAVARDTVTRVAFEADGPLRAGTPVRVTLVVPGAAAPVVAAVSPSGERDPIALARDPFDSRRWTGHYWPRTPGWHGLQIGPERVTHFRVSHSSEWIGLEAAARLSATMQRLPGDAPRVPRQSPLAWRLGAFAALLTLLTWLWLERRLGT